MAKPKVLPNFGLGTPNPDANTIVIFAYKYRKIAHSLLPKTFKSLIKCTFLTDKGFGKCTFPKLNIMHFCTA